MRTRNHQPLTPLNECEFVRSVGNWSISISPTGLHQGASVRILLTKPLVGNSNTAPTRAIQSIEELSDIELIRRLLAFKPDLTCVITKKSANVSASAQLSDLIEHDAWGPLCPKHIEEVFEAMRWGGRYERRLANNSGGESSLPEIAHLSEVINEISETVNDTASTTDVSKLDKLLAESKSRTGLLASQMAANLQAHKRAGAPKGHALKMSLLDSLNQLQTLDELRGKSGRLMLGKRLPRELDPRHLSPEEELEVSWFEWAEHNKVESCINDRSEKAILLERLATQRAIYLTAGMPGDPTLSETCESTEAVDALNQDLLRRESWAGRLEFRALVVVPHPDNNDLLCWQELRIPSIGDCSSFQKLCESASPWSLSGLDGLRPPEHIKEPLRVRLVADADFTYRLVVYFMRENEEIHISKLKSLRLASLWSLENEAESADKRKSRTLLHLVIPLAAACPPIGSLVRLFDNDEFKPQLQLTADQVKLFKTRWLPALIRMGVSVELPPEKTQQAAISAPPVVPRSEAIIERFRNEQADRLARSVNAAPQHPLWRTGKISLPKKPRRELDLMEGDRGSVSETRSGHLLWRLATARELHAPRMMLQNRDASHLPSIYEELLAQESIAKRLEFLCLVRVPAVGEPNEFEWKELRLTNFTDCSSFSSMVLSALSLPVLLDISANVHNEDWQYFDCNMALRVRLEAVRDSTSHPFRISVICVLDGLEHNAAELDELRAAALWSTAPDQTNHQTFRSRGVLQRIIPLAAMCPPIGSLVRLFHDDRYEPRLDLTLEDTIRFLADWAPRLREAGYEILIPAALDPHKKVSPKIGYQIQKEGSGHFSWSNLARFSAQAYLNDTELSAEDVNRLVKEKQRLFELRGEWYYFEAAELDKVIDKLLHQQAGTLTYWDWLKEALAECGNDSKQQDGEGSRIEMERFRSAITELWGENSAREMSISQPAGLHLNLHPHQLEGLSWLASRSRIRLGACLADDMGVGKTPQTIAWILHQRSLGERAPVLLICPVSLIKQWKSEANEKFARLMVLEYHGRKKTDSATWFRQIVREYDLVVTTYALAINQIELLKAYPWSAVILDEAQVIKNPDSKTAKAVKQIRAPFRLALTGTPIENRPLDLWSIFDFINPGLLRSREQFEEEFGKAKAGSPELAKLGQIVAPFLKHRLLSTVRPDLATEDIPAICSLTEEQATQYEAHLRTAEVQIRKADKSKQRSAMLESLTALKQICNHPALHPGEENKALMSKDGELRSGKLERLRHVLTEVLERREHAMIFTQYITKMGDLLDTFVRDVLKKTPLFYSGEQSPNARAEVVKKFEQDKEYSFPFLIVSLRAGGTGLNITRPRHVIHFDRWWNPAVEKQATARALRGEDKTVFVHKFICAGTLEDRIDRLLKEKQQLADELFQVGDDSESSPLTSLPLDEFFNLIRLDRNEATV